MRDDTPAPRVLILCADRLLSRGLALYAQDMGFEPLWQDPNGLPSFSPEELSRLMKAFGASLLWADADDCPQDTDGLPSGFPAVLWSREQKRNSRGDELPARIRRPVDTALLEKLSCLCAEAGSDYPAVPAVPSGTVVGQERISPCGIGRSAGTNLPALTPLEARMYAYFVSHRGELVTRETLKTLLNVPPDGGGNMTDVYVGRLRKKLEKPGERLITAVRGKGYRML